MKFRYFTTLILVLWSIGLAAQRNVRDSSTVITAIGAHVGYNFPMADMAKRFGSAGQVGGAFMLKLKSNWVIQFDGTYFFGSTVKEDSIFKNFTTPQGIIIDRTGNPAEIKVTERGYTFMLSAGKLFPVIGPNPNSGLNLSLGVGFMEHKLLIQEDLGAVPQLSGEYLKGYDRLSNGIAFRQSFGYQHFSNFRLINYYIGFEITEGLTRNRRDLNFDTMKRDDSQRLDILASIVVRWYFPLYKRVPLDSYLY